MKRNVIAATEREIRMIGDLGLLLFFRFLEIAIGFFEKEEETLEGYVIMSLADTQCVVPWLESRCININIFGSFKTFRAVSFC